MIYCFKSFIDESHIGTRLGLLAFHLALVEHPQDALVVWTLSSILYHGTWSKAIEFARQNVKGHGQFVPEILEPSESKSDELLLEETCRLASLVKSSVDALTRTDVLQQSLTRYPDSLPCLGLVSLDHHVALCSFGKSCPCGFCF